MSGGDKMPKRLTENTYLSDVSVLGNLPTLKDAVAAAKKVPLAPLTPARLKTVFKFVMLAIESDIKGNGNIIRQAVTYGSHFKLRGDEVRQVLSMSVGRIYEKITGKDAPKPKVVRIPINTAEEYPAAPVPVEH